MNITEYNSELLFKYANKLNRENIPVDAKLILLKIYANDLEIELTHDSCLEISSFNSFLFSS